MKLIITMTALFLSITAFSHVAGETIGADFRGKQCGGGSGFCGSVPDPLNKTQNTNMKNFKAIKSSSTSMILELCVNTMSKEDQIKFFGKMYSKITVNEKLTFIQEDDYEFSFDVLLYLDLDPRYKYLKKGEYPLEIVNKNVQVLLTLSKQP